MAKYPIVYARLAALAAILFFLPAAADARHRSNRREDERNWSTARGPFEIIVSIAKQQVTIYDQAGPLAHASISTGMAGHATPMGVFTVISKARWHESNIYSGAPMPYMQRITWSGIALHAGPRPGYPASHGCIRLPEDFAVKLFHTTKVGTRVIVTRSPVEPVAIENAKLFVYKTSVPAEESIKSTLPSAATVSVDQNTPSTEPKPTAVAADQPGTSAAQQAAPSASSQRPISIFVSRKQQRVFIRQGFTPLLDLPVTIAEPDRPLGTHVFTALALKDNGKNFRWDVVSIPSSYRQKERHVARHERDDVGEENPAEVLDRINLPPEAIQKISALIIPGSSLIVSDNELSDETDSDTDFIVLTP